jgi:cation transporter-like permease
MSQDSEKHLQEPVLTVARKDFNALRKEWTVEQALHALKLDPKIAAGPVTLALADVCSIVFYFVLAAVLL